MFSIFEHINKDNLLSLTFDKTCYIQFIAKNVSFIDMDIGYDDKIMTIVSNTEFLGIVTDNTLLWKIHIFRIIPKLSVVF
jgi:hypothetical protein